MTEARVMVVDDHPLTQEGLSLAARAAIPGVDVDAAAQVSEAATLIAARGPYRLILLDFSLPDSNGYAGMIRLQQLAPQTPILVVTAHDKAHLVEAARALGAAGFIAKSQPLDRIAQAVGQVAAGIPHFPASVAPDPVIATARERIAKLSRAQHLVLFALADGRANKQIAYDLSISEATVKAHLTAVFRKLGVVNRAQALLAVGPLLHGVREDAS